MPVMQYVAPQLWAWREGRMKKVRRWVDRLACILPFEEEYFREHGVNATFVGHPLFDELPAQREPPTATAVPRPSAGDRPAAGLAPVGGRRRTSRGCSKRRERIRARVPRRDVPRPDDARDAPGRRARRWRSSRGTGWRPRFEQRRVRRDGPRAATCA